MGGFIIAPSLNYKSCYTSLSNLEKIIMIPRVLFLLSLLFALFASIEIVNVHFGQEKRVPGKVVMITSVETSTKTVGLMEVKDHQTTHFLVDVAVVDSKNNFITRCTVKSLEGFAKDSLTEATVMIGKLYKDNRCLALKVKNPKDETAKDGVDKMVVHSPVSRP